MVPWEKNLRTESKAPPKKDPLPTMASKKDGTLKRAMGKGRKGGGWGGGWGGGGDFGGGGGGGMDGRPSIGTWTKTQNYLQILKELSGKVWKPSCGDVGCVLFGDGDGGDGPKA